MFYLIVISWYDKLKKLGEGNNKIIKYTFLSISSLGIAIGFVRIIQSGIAFGIFEFYSGISLIMIILFWVVLTI